MITRKPQLSRKISWVKLTRKFIEDQREVFRARLTFESAEEEKRNSDE